MQAWQSSGEQSPVRQGRLARGTFTRKCLPCPILLMLVSLVTPALNVLPSASSAPACESSPTRQPCATSEQLKADTTNLEEEARLVAGLEEIVISDVLFVLAARFECGHWVRIEREGREEVLGPVEQGLTGRLVKEVGHNKIAVAMEGGDLIGCEVRLEAVRDDAHRGWGQLMEGRGRSREEGSRGKVTRRQTRCLIECAREGRR